MLSNSLHCSKCSRHSTRVLASLLSHAAYGAWGQEAYGEVGMGELIACWGPQEDRRRWKKKGNQTWRSVVLCFTAQRAAKIGKISCFSLRSRFLFFLGFFLPLKRLLNCQIWKKIVWFDVTIACSGVQALGWEYKELESSGVHPLHINFSAGVGLSVPVPSTVTENKCLFFFEEMGTRIFPGKKAVLGHNCSIGEVCFWM